ncbi:hypothetical protein [Chryseobacterium sp. FH1]|uniref:hypothetical protein n=1 Tax=Chryseobacterium sp. FH1 TaxID=1233951 RepID=UPI0004E3FAE9|nr:hypothetical protein [Chryseobacterium sp. FH1]KFC19357.1 hypothetical protein IO90_08610 [Chryseobacterium sp. FH1]
MNKCLVTTLPGVAVSGNLKKLNEIIFNFVERPNWVAGNSNYVVINIATITAVKFTIEDGYFTDNLGNNTGTTFTTVTGNNSIIMRVAGSNAKLRCENKYYISYFGLPFTPFCTPFNGIIPKYIPAIDSIELKYLTNLQYFNVGMHFMITGEASNINGESFIYYNAFNPNYVIDVSYNNYKQPLIGSGYNIIKGANLKEFTTGFFAIDFNINDFNDDIEIIDFWDGVLKGDITNKRFNKIRRLNLGFALTFKPFEVTGDVDFLTYDNPNDIMINFRNAPQLKGNVGGFGKRCYLFISNGISEFTYTQGTARTHIMALNNVKLTSGLDNYLIDMASLPINPGVDTGMYNSGSEKIISLIGERTSASNSAVSTLVSKGFVVIINGLPT